MSSKEDFDHIVGHWLMGIPYIWHPGEGTFETASREYIIQARALNIRFKSGCDVVKRYFRPFTLSHTVPKPENFRVNGLQYLPGVSYREALEIISKTVIHRIYTVKDITNQRIYTIDIPLPEPKFMTPIAGKRTLIRYAKKEMLISDRLWMWLLLNLPKTGRVCAVTASVKSNYFYTLQLNYVRDQYRDFSWDHDFKKNLLRCISLLDVRFIISPLRIIYTTVRGKRKTHTAHANVLILDKKIHHVYTFDPWGHSKIETLGEDVKRILVENASSQFKNWEVIPTIDWCPRFQDIERERRRGDPGGFCQTWMIWVIHLLLQNEGDEDLQSLLHSARVSLKGKYKQDFKRFIRSYRKTIEEHPEIKGLLRSQLQVKIDRYTKNYISFLEGLEKEL
jgi:hypothetical protein